MEILKKKSGFTLIELMVVVAIMGILSTVAIVNYASIGKKSTVTMAAQNLASDIRRVQSFALNGKIADSNRGRWGVYFDLASSSNYIIFADKDLNNLRASSEDYEVVNLPKNVKIKNVDPGPASTVVYIPPDPKILISSSTISTSTVTLSDPEGNNERKIEFNIFGLVDIE